MRKKLNIKMSLLSTQKIPRIYTQKIPGTNKWVLECHRKQGYLQESIALLYTCNKKVKR